MEIVETAIFKFDELPDDAKEKAREWYREGAFDYNWWEFVYEDFTQICEILGVEISTREQGYYPANSYTRKTSTVQQIFFSGFWSQGDGACFEGTYAYKKGSVKKIKEYAPKDIDLHWIAEQLFNVQAKNFFSVTATIKHSGYYYHKFSTSINVYKVYGNQYWVDEADADAETADTITELMRDLMEWLYKTLEKEYDWMNSDEQVDDSILANEYDFNECGERW